MHPSGVACLCVPAPSPLSVPSSWPSHDASPSLCVCAFGSPAATVSAMTLFWHLFRCSASPAVLVGVGCRHKAPQAGGPKPQRFISPGSGHLCGPRGPVPPGTPRALDEVPPLGAPLTLIVSLLA